MRVWDVQTGRELQRFARHSGGVTGVAVSPDGAAVLSSGRDQTLRLWGLRNGQEIRQFAVPRGLVLSVAFSPDGTQAVSGHFDTIARLWEVDGGRELRRLQGHRQMVSAALYRSFSNRVVSFSSPVIQTGSPQTNFGGAAMKTAVAVIGMPAFSLTYAISASRRT